MTNAIPTPKAMPAKRKDQATEKSKSKRKRKPYVGTIGTSVGQMIREAQRANLSVYPPRDDHEARQAANKR